MAGSIGRFNRGIADARNRGRKSAEAKERECVHHTCNFGEGTSSSARRSARRESRRRVGGDRSGRRSAVGADANEIR